METRFPDRLFWPLAILGLTTVRLPYLLSPNRILDGDEAILGLMAKHTAYFTEFPLFFPGQSYGLSFMETLPAAAAFRLFGVGSLALSLAMYGLFLCGVWLYESGFRNLSGSRGWSRVLALALGLLPVWIVWSFKARGGYLSAFLLGAFILRLVTAGDFKGHRAFLVGCASGILLFAQPLWLVAFLPLLILPFTRGAGWKEGAVLVAMAVATAAPFAYISSNTQAYWVPEVFGSPSFAALAHLPGTLYRMFTGFFYLNEIRPVPWEVGGIGVVLTAALLLVFLILGARFVRTRDWPHAVMTLALLASISGVLVLLDLQPRYLLQASVVLVAALALILGRLGVAFSGPPRIVAMLGLLALAGAAPSVSEFRPIHPASGGDLEAGLRSLIQDLRDRGVEGVYSMGGLLQWQILFYGNEEIPARFSSPLDRLPEYPRQVDDAFAEGRAVALVGTMEQAEPVLRSPLGRLMERSGGDYFIMTDVSRPFLESIGFMFLPEG
jgi:hypothetical protein